MARFTFVLFSGLWAQVAVGLPPRPTNTKRGLFSSDPSVTISNPSATIVGSTDSFLGITSGTIDTFNGIPFAQPPVGALRLKPPQPLTTSLGTVQATTSLPPSCPQFFVQDSNLSGVAGTALDLVLASPAFSNRLIKGQEDCLTLNVQRPTGTNSSSKLPVLLWIFGGGFEVGSTSTYDASTLLSNAMALGKPYVFVAVNYRVGGFGFLPGKEILKDGSANLGLLDQRLGMEWVADNIAEFGGDPDQVTIWGESAGSLSVFDHMLLYDGNNTYKGKPLFRGGIMDSGTFIPVDPVDTAKGQQVYDTVVQSAGCSNQTDTLACLRTVSFDTLFSATNSVPGIFGFHSVALSYLPRPDGVTITQSPEDLLTAGKFAKVPFIVGDQEDEGTLFALFQSNLTTSADIENYLSSIYFQSASPQLIQDLVNSYPDDPAAGSPFRTGDSNNWYPQFKRLAAILGDATFTLTRRVALNLTSTASSAPSWSYLGTYNHGIPIMGTFHGTDLLKVFFGVDAGFAGQAIQQYYFNFVYNLDPNNATGGAPATAAAKAVQVPTWPVWSQQQMMMNFSSDAAEVIPDNFRQQSFDILSGNVKGFHF
ncbi:Alpha/Beta hydrolase protein [Rhexocercosporidium sp. MPI-PUGE-AT-0058]|nr:Alpha/Beta hydrolase protein [Rhexocercosporidium sp. MPI-PUGE-AT-0058]